MKYSTHVTLDQYEEDLKTELAEQLGLNKRQAWDMLKGSEDIIAANWWDNKTVEQTAEEIKVKDIIGF